MIVLIAVLNDFPIMMIAYDNTIVAPRPVRWDMERVLTVSSVIGVIGVISAFGLFWIAEKYLHLARPVVQSLMFLKLLVAGHLTIYITRSAGTFWKRPWPNWRLVVACGDNPAHRNPGRGLRMGHDASGMEIRAGSVGLCARMVCPNDLVKVRGLPTVASGHRQPSAPLGENQRKPSSAATAKVASAAS